MTMTSCLLGPYMPVPVPAGSPHAHQIPARARACVHWIHAHPCPCLMDPHTHAPGPHACSLAGSPHRLAHRVPTHARSQGLHTCTHRAHAHVLAPGLHMRSLIGSPCTRICVCWMHHVCIPQLYVLGGLYVVVVVLFCNLV